STIKPPVKWAHGRLQNLTYTFYILRLSPLNKCGCSPKKPGTANQLFGFLLLVIAAHGLAGVHDDDKGLAVMTVYQTHQLAHPATGHDDGEDILGTVHAPTFADGDAKAVIPQKPDQAVALGLDDDLDAGIAQGHSLFQKDP